MEKCLTSIDKRMQRHTPRILESMNDMDLLSHNDMREATPLLLLAVPQIQSKQKSTTFGRTMTPHIHKFTCDSDDYTIIVACMGALKVTDTSNFWSIISWPLGIRGLWGN